MIFSSKLILSPLSDDSHGDSDERRFSFKRSDISPKDTDTLKRVIL